LINYLDYIKDFEDLRAENEKMYELRQIFNTKIDSYVEWYYSDNITSIDDEDQDFNDDGLTNN